MKKFLSSLICGVMLFSVCSAQTFTDMPDNWSTQALTNAVDNGLISGSDGLIRPNDPLTRAEMATIMVRAFGVEEAADISGFTDVKKGDWFYENMAKAVAMGAFTGDGQNLNPNNNISRQETFVVLARIFSLNYDAEINKYLDSSSPTDTPRYLPADTVLSQFSDKDQIASWAKELVAAVVASGYVGGSNGMINPTNNITRAEFAVVMDRLVKTYISVPGTYSDLPEGSVVIRSKDVIIKDADIKGDLVIGEGAIDGASLINTNVYGRYIARAGKKNTIESGAFSSIRLIRPGVVVAGSNPTYDIRYIGKDAEYVDYIDFNMGE